MSYKGRVAGDAASLVKFRVVVQRGEIQRVKGVKFRGIDTCESTWKNFVDEIRFPVTNRRFRGRVQDPGWTWKVRGMFGARGRTAKGTLHLRTPVCDDPALRWRVRRR